MPTTSFVTNCFEHNFRIMLRGDFLRNIIQGNMFGFDDRMLLINDVDSRLEVSRMADALVSRDVIDGYMFIEDTVDEVLARFDLTRDFLGRGLVYGIPQWSAIFNGRCDNIVYWSGDCKLDKDHDWVSRGAEILSENKDVAVVNPLWNNDEAGARSESLRDAGDHYLGLGFSDQVFMIQRSTWDARIYRETNPASERYPSYAGELFEKRADAWMRNNGKLRATLKSCSWIHPVYPPPDKH